MGGGAERFSSSVVCARMECIGHQSRFVRLNQTYTDLPEADKTAPLSAPIHTALQTTEKESAPPLPFRELLSRRPGQNGNV